MAGGWVRSATDLDHKATKTAQGRVALLTRCCISREQEGSESHNVTTPYITPGQHHEVKPETKAEAILDENTQAKDTLGSFGSKFHLLSSVLQHPAIQAVVAMLGLWLLIGWIEKLTEVYLFTNYRNVGILTNELQEHLFLTIIMGLCVLWYTSSVQKLLICVLVVLVLPKSLGHHWTSC